jgi:catecholate siderophore receptor
VQKVEGFELGIVGKVTKAIQIMFGYTYMNSIVVESKEAAELGNAVGNTPKHMASIWATWESPWRTQFGAGAQYVHHRTVSISNPEFIDGYYLFDAMAAYHLTDKVDLRVNLQNITNEFYFERVHGGGQHGVPGAGRTALFSVAVRY